jgi:pimeloyl-ACP methyl ester carboxylesterase
MRRWVWRVAAFVVFLCVVSAAGASYEYIAARRDLAAAPQPGSLIDVGGHRLHLWCAGQGTPVVIFESSAGGTALDWYRVQNDVAGFTTACAYDRAGMGYSDAGPSPRTSERIADELAELVRRSGMRGPVILVGWSWGGLYVRAYATRHEIDVAGLVLVDSSHEDQAEKFAAAGFGSGISVFAFLLPRLLPPAAALGMLRLIPNPFVTRLDTVPEPVRGFVQATTYRPSYFQANYDEAISERDTADEVRSSRRLLSMPVVVLTAGQVRVKTDPRDNARIMDIWMRLQRDLLRLSPRSCQIIATNSAHMIPYEAPDVVVRSVRVTIDAWKMSSTPMCSQ